jgi:hypothetical protein
MFHLRAIGWAELMPAEAERRGDTMDHVIAQPAT